MKILFSGDPHIKTDNHEEIDILILELQKICESNHIDHIIIGGDLMHYHERIFTQALNKSLDFVTFLSTFAPVYILVGNHDMINNQQFLTSNHWLNVFSHYKNVKIVEKPIVLKEKAESMFTFLMCPYVYPGRFVEAIETVSKDWKGYNVIFAHQEFKGCKMGAIVSKDGDEWSEEFPQIISGHIHDKQRVKKNLYYTGSSLQHSYGEGSDKSLCLISIENNEINFEDVYLQIKRKKILYVDINNIEEVKEMLKSDIEYKIALKGDAIEEFKALKKSAIFKELSELDNVKNIVFKTKTVEKLNELSTEENRSNVISDDFCEHLDKIIRNTNDQYLISFYEHIMYDKEDISEQDILII